MPDAQNPTVSADIAAELVPLLRHIQNGLKRFACCGRPDEPFTALEDFQRMRQWSPKLEWPEYMRAVAGARPDAKELDQWFRRTVKLLRYAEELGLVESVEVLGGETPHIVEVGELTIDGETFLAQKMAEQAKADLRELQEQEAKLSPSRLKARAAYDWAMENINGADRMTIAELFDAIMSHPQEGMTDCIPNNAEAFGRYLREAGVKRYSRTGKPRVGRSVRRCKEF